ncbi:MAG: TRAM domain-containing protein, partial [Angustibacter sp.]
MSPVTPAHDRGRRSKASHDTPAPASVSLIGQIHEVDITAVAHGGHCVGRADGRVLFVRHTAPGERVRARITSGTSTDRFLRADAVEVLRPSPERVASRCAVSGPGGCGGCDWQHLSLAGQRALKADVIAEQFRRLAGLDVAVEV